jgi:hypothetical protein
LSTDQDKVLSMRVLCERGDDSGEVVRREPAVLVGR